MDKQIFSAVFKTLSYADIFDFPMTFEEIWRYLIYKKRVSQKELSKVLNDMEDLIDKKGKFYYLHGSAKNIDLRKEKERHSRRKLAIAKKIAGFISHIPGIRLVGVSGSLSVGNSKKTDDIDFFIITQKNSLWTTRFLVSALLFMLGAKRRVGEAFVQDKICPNMYIAEDNLKLQRNTRNLFTAHEIVQLKVIVNKDQTFEKFQSANSWILNFLPNIAKAKSSYVDCHKSDVLRLEKSGFLPKALKLLIEKTLFNFQIRYMRKRRTNEVILENIAKFHPNDKTREVLKSYRKRYSLCKIKTDYKNKSEKPEKLSYRGYVYTLGY